MVEETEVRNIKFGPVDQDNHLDITSFGWPVLPRYWLHDADA